MQLQVQKHPVPARLELPDNVRSRGVVQFHSDLDEGPLVSELPEKRHRFFRRREIAGDDHIARPIEFICHVLLL